MKKKFLKKQNQVTNIFQEIWSKSEVYDDAATANKSKKRYSFLSDHKYNKWIKKTMLHKTKKHEPKIIDFGCGLGVSAYAILKEYKNFDYTGHDLIDLKKTKIYLKKKGFNKITLKRNDFSQSKNIEKNKYDLALALGSLHHTRSVKFSLKNTSKYLKKGGRYIGWIINEQSPLRKSTDSILRKYYLSLKTNREKWNEAKKHARLSKIISKKLGNSKIKLDFDIPSWEIKKGKYKLQTLIFDYIVKIDYSPTLFRSAHQIFDWYTPTYYHQTSRDKLKKIIESMRVSNIEIVTKRNGHFFTFIK